MNKKMIFAVVAGTVLSGVSAWAVSINGVDVVPVSGGSEQDSGFGAVSYNYWMGQKEITYDQFSAASGIFGGSVSEDTWVGSLGGSAPAVNVSWNEAAQYCNWLTSGNINNGAYTIDGSGKVTAATDHSGAGMTTLVSTYGYVFVLPTEDEWYRAAYFNSGSSTFSLYANGTGTPPVDGVDSVYNAASPWAAGSGNPEQNGTYDMMGNVWEHMEAANSIADPGTVSREPLDFGDSAQEMVYRGGAFYYGESGLRKDVNELAQGREFELDVIGFRIVAIPEPGTISLMSLSTVSLFLTRTIRRRKRMGMTVLPIRHEHVCDEFYMERKNAQLAEYQEEDFLAILFDLSKRGISSAWTRIVNSYQSVDKSFWNWMVIRHERKLAKRMEFRKSLRTKFIDGIDSFLAIIMK